MKISRTHAKRRKKREERERERERCNICFFFLGLLTAGGLVVREALGSKAHVQHVHHLRAQVGQKQRHRPQRHVRLDEGRKKHRKEDGKKEKTNERKKARKKERKKKRKKKERKKERTKERTNERKKMMKKKENEDQDQEGEQEGAKKTSMEDLFLSSLFLFHLPCARTHRMAAAAGLRALARFRRTAAVGGTLLAAYAVGGDGLHATGPAGRPALHYARGHSSTS